MLSSVLLLQTISRNMYRILFFLSLVLSGTAGRAQFNQVVAGAEVSNYGQIDLSLTRGHKWTSERTPRPGYFTVIDRADFTGYSDQNNIDGYIKKTGNTAFLFPVGNGGDLRTLEISKPSSITDAYATAWIEGDPGNQLDPTAPFAGAHPTTAVSTPIIAVSKIGQWDWQVGEAGNLGDQSTGNGVGMKVTVSIPDLSSFADKNELRLVGWNGSSWIDLSGRVSANGNRENSKLTGTLIAGISSVAVGKVRLTPAGQLLSISCRSTNCNTVINWETSQEMESSLFTIEQSRDGIQFQAIRTVPGSGSPNGARYVEPIAQWNGIAYYRIRMENANGSTIFSTVLSNNNNCRDNERVRIYPNPVTEDAEIHIAFTTAYAGAAELRIYNQLGQKVKTKAVQCISGANLISTLVKDLSNGSYLVELRSSDGNILSGANQFIKK